jgi:hypothetical protein
MCTAGLASSHLGLVDPLWEPLQVAVAQQGVAVDLDGVQLWHVNEGILLYSGNDIIQQVQLLQRVKTNEGLVAHGLDLVPAKGEDLKVGQVPEGSSHVFYRVTEKKIQWSYIHFDQTEASF